MGMESWLGAPQVTDRRSQAPVCRRGSQGTIERVESQAGQMEDACPLPGVRSGKCLDACHAQGGDVSAAVLAEEDFALHFRTDRLPIVVVEYQAIHIVGEVFDIARD